MIVSHSKRTVSILVVLGALAAVFVACREVPDDDDFGANSALATGRGAADAAGADPQEASPGARGPTIADAADCGAPLVPGADRRCTVQVGGRTREVLVYAPRTYDPHRPSALVVDAHGAQESAAAQAGKEPFFDWPLLGLGSGWRLLADREGFIVAQPQGFGNAWSEADADFMLKIPAFVGATAAVDPKRVYMTGISNGGLLTYWTACRDTNVYRGFAPVSAAGAPPCALTQHAPIIHFHAPTDRLVSLATGETAFQRLRTGNHCQRGPRPSWSFGGGSVDQRALCLASTGGGAAAQWHLTPCDAAAAGTTCELWDECDVGSKAMFCTVSPDRQHHFDMMGGHILYINGTNLSLAAVAWEFFKTFQQL